MGVIACCFAGRRDRMEVQLHYMRDLLDRAVIDWYDVWNFAWSKPDIEFVESLSALHARIRVRHAPIDASAGAGRGGPVAVQQIGYFYTHGYPADQHVDDVFIKVDDDVVWIDTERMADFVEARRANPTPFLLSAEICNRDVDASRRRGLYQHVRFNAGIRQTRLPLRVEAFPSARRLSINFCSWLGRDLPPIIESFAARGTGNEDEIHLCSHIPRALGRDNAVLRNFHVAHLSFGGQEPVPRWLLNHYRRLAGLPRV